MPKKGYTLEEITEEKKNPKRRIKLDKVRKLLQSRIDMDMYSLALLKGRDDPTVYRDRSYLQTRIDAFNGLLTAIYFL
jgi:hypothetical protein